MDSVFLFLVLLVLQAHKKRNKNAPCLAEEHCTERFQIKRLWGGQAVRFKVHVGRWGSEYLNMPTQPEIVWFSPPHHTHTDAHAFHQLHYSMAKGEPLTKAFEGDEF